MRPKQYATTQTLLVDGFAFELGLAAAAPAATTTAATATAAAVCMSVCLYAVAATA